MLLCVRPGQKGRSRSTAITRNVTHKGAELSTVKILHVMHVVMHFSMNCKLYLQLNMLLIILSQHSSGGSFAASQDTESHPCPSLVLVPYWPQRCNVNRNSW